MILVIDNYDSFVHNLARYVRELGGATTVHRNDTLLVAECCAMSLQGIILSPGPGQPETAGICKELIAACPDTPLLGVCLGHQCLAEVYGGETVPSKEPMHGRSSKITHDATGVFEGLVSPIEAGRYHSLSVNIDNAEDLIVQAATEDGEIMGLRHREFPHFGVQFHPESLLTVKGVDIIRNFIKLAGERNA